MELKNIKTKVIMKRDFKSHEQYHDTINKHMKNEWESLISVTSGIPKNSFVVLMKRVYA